MTGSLPGIARWSTTARAGHARSDHRADRQVAARRAVLDPGCATGVPVAAELAGRYRVTGVDISPEHIQQAARNVPGAEFICSDALAVTFPAGHFDAIISLYTFDHIPRDEHRDLLGRLRRWLRPGGLLLLSIEDLDEPGTVTEWQGADMYFSMFSADATRQMYRFSSGKRLINSSSGAGSWS